ncbi:MAG: 6-phosphogluconolactonase [Bacteroidetes bacterium]|nr:MAG: 6-phosphogluconolactonase [Bacteroidota bacterium]
MHMHVYEGEKSLIAAFADYIIEQVNRSIQSQGFCNISLAGGNSPKAAYTLLASPPLTHQVDWTKVFFFFGDERYVPANNPQYNGGMVDQVFFQPLEIKKHQIFLIDTTLPPDLAAQQYWNDIQAHFKGSPIEFDLILLGLGDNAHTASLFPFTEVLWETEPEVKAVYLKRENVYRITMTAPLINQGKQIAFLVYGARKALAVQHVIQGQKDIAQFPAQLIQPVKGELHWFLDATAAALLTNK